MIEVTDWATVQWIEGERYVSMVPFVGQFNVGADNVTIENLIVDGWGSSVGIHAQQHRNVKLINPIVSNAVTGIYGKTENPGSDRHVHLGLKIINGEVKDCEDIGIKLMAADCSVIGTRIHHVGHDGVHVQGDDCEVSWCHIWYTDLKTLTGQILGDGIQFNDSERAKITHNYVDHSHLATKHCIACHGGDDCIIEHNKLVGAWRVMGFNGNRGIIRHNWIQAVANPTHPDYALTNHFKTGDMLHLGRFDTIDLHDNHFDTDGLALDNVTLECA